MDSVRRQPKAVFMAFGTKGDVYPIAAIAAAFACEEEVQYHVVFITHSAHHDLMEHLTTKEVTCFPVSSPPALSPSQHNNTSDCMKLSFHQQKKKLTRDHRQECILIFENIFRDVPPMEGDLVIINFFALEGWSLAEVFGVRCVVAAPYVVPYSAPSSFERKFKQELPLLYDYLQTAPSNKICWKDVIHWMWPLFTEEWGTWRATQLHLSPLPFTDPVTSHPMWHNRPFSPLLLYGFSKEVVECPGYWPSNVHVCGFWNLPMEWQFSCKECAQITVLPSSENMNTEAELCSSHTELQHFLNTPVSQPPVFIGLSSIGSMGFMRNPHLLLEVVKNVVEVTNYRFVLFTSGYEPLEDAATTLSSSPEFINDGISLFSGRLFCFSGSVPYKWLFPKCAAAIHHGGSGSTSAALHAGTPQVICPFVLDQFYWAERMFWVGVGPEPLKRTELVPDEDDDISINALTRSIDYALSNKVKANASKIAQRLSSEYLANGLMGLQGTLYAGSNCFHRRKVIYGSYPNDTTKTDTKDLHEIFGKSIEFQESVAPTLSGSTTNTESQRNPSSFIEAAIRVAGCSYEYGTNWGTQIGWMYGSTTEDILTGLNIHGKGYRSVICIPDPPAFLGCAPTTYPSTSTQQKRWATGLLEILFTNKSPLLLTIKGNLWFRQALAYLWLSSWAIRSIPELLYGILPSYCIMTGARFLPNINDRTFLIPGGIFVIFNLYSLWEFRRLNLSFRMWWNLQSMGRVTAMTAYLFAFVTVVFKLFGLSDTVFEVTQKEESNDDEEASGRFTYDTSPMFVPGVVIVLISSTALINGMSKLEVVGFGEMFCSVLVTLCFWEYLKGLFGKGKNRIPSSTIWKAGALALFFVQVCRRSS